MKTILIYGWYGRSNIGDELFRDAFVKILPEFDLRFVSKIDVSVLKGVDAVIFGGGSFVYAKPNVTNDALLKMKSMPVFYVGIGVENVVDPIHQEIMKTSCGVFTRSQESLQLLNDLGIAAKYFPDIVFSLSENSVIKVAIKKSILVMTNIETVPKWSSPHWAHLGWDHFKDEFAQTLDCLVEEGFKVDFLPSCVNETMSDTWPAGEILSRMTRRGKSKILNMPQAKIEDVTGTISKYSVVVSQRFHGVILSKLSQRPCVVIHHHDKLKNVFPAAEQSVSFYESSKALLLKAIKSAVDQKVDPFVADFSEVTKTIKNKLE